MITHDKVLYLITPYVNTIKVTGKNDEYEEVNTSPIEFVGFMSHGFDWQRNHVARNGTKYCMLDYYMMITMPIFDVETE